MWEKSFLENPIFFHSFTLLLVLVLTPILLTLAIYFEDFFLAHLFTCWDFLPQEPSLAIVFDCIWFDFKFKTFLFKFQIIFSIKLVIFAKCFVSFFWYDQLKEGSFHTNLFCFQVINFFLLSFGRLNCFAYQLDQFKKFWFEIIWIVTVFRIEYFWWLVIVFFFKAIYVFVRIFFKLKGQRQRFFVTNQTVFTARFNFLMKFHRLEFCIIGWVFKLIWA